ncbi:site-specific integrase [Mucilaginibacter sp. 21P]|uniref:site-specific integrase n=1 Tax=Mucilaginibacter sp. 21P TaxID=2778902 RepID=UPI001C565763|nr:site-specific integrase [Mucilaginibacter sp. 21P]QXV63909.1 site-specific integrase [Mucilaginibacter sp. 21P]
MATIKQIILPHHQKEDKTWNVKIRLTHKRKSIYMDTVYFVTSKQISKSFEIKDRFILNKVLEEVESYRNGLNEIGSKAGHLDVWQLAERLKYQKFNDPKSLTPEEIDVISYGRSKVNELKDLKRMSSAGNMTTVLNSLIDYFQSEHVPISAITAKMLSKYEIFLRKPRVLFRKNQFEKLIKIKEPGLTNNGIHCHFRDLRILFNNVKDHYNDEDLGITIIKHYPFKKFKIIRYKPRRKMKLTRSMVVAIGNIMSKPGSRVELAKDLFMLSFYLCGMNAVDLYKIQRTKDLPERVEYSRSKTASRRTDEAFISIKLIPEARPLFLKYAEKLSERYGTHNTLDQALAYGMRSIGKTLGISNLEFYDARHAFADIARNKCRFSVDDVALALNHIDNENSVTDLYLSKDWSIIDEIQAAVINILKEEV